MIDFGPMVASNYTAGGKPVPWSVAIFSARESVDVLRSCIEAVALACAGMEAVVDVLVNGNPRLADEIADSEVPAHCLDTAIRQRIWHFETADKANTWNEYVHAMWPDSTTTFFVDGYVRVKRDALRLICEALAVDTGRLAASGVPSVGSSAQRLRREMTEEGGIHGNLYALPRGTMARLRSTGFRIPLGLYRTDPLLAAVLAFNLDPSRYDWEWSRIAVVTEASWEYDAMNWWRPTHIRTQLRRMIRQAQGSLENAAIRQYLAVEKRPPAQLPPSVQELVLPWLGAFPKEARAIFRRRPLGLLAARKLNAQWPAPQGAGRIRLVRELDTRHAGQVQEEVPAVATGVR